MIAIYYLAYLYPLSMVVGYHLGGLGTWLTQGLSLVLYPLLDAVLTGTGVESIPRDQPVKRFLLMLAIWLYVPVQAVLLIWVLSIVKTASLSTLEVMGLVYSLALTSGTIGITVAHELIHRSNRWERGLGVAMLSLVSYAPFRIYHVAGHHRYVATELDASSARQGESMYRFCLRSMVGNVWGAWQIEVARLRRRGRSPWSPHNRMLHYLGIQLGLCGLLTWLMGWSGLVVFLVQSLLAVMVLETTNYLQHYGLSRARLPSGNYERVSSVHAWNARHPLTNGILFNLARHSEHHMADWLRYPELGIQPRAPELPAGYFGMALLALVPPLWRKVMDPRVESVRRGTALRAEEKEVRGDGTA